MLMSQNPGSSVDVGDSKAVAEDLVKGVRPFKAGDNYSISGRKVRQKSTLDHDIGQVPLSENAEDIPSDSLIWEVVNKVTATQDSETRTSSDDWCTASFDGALSNDGEYPFYGDKIKSSDPFIMTMILVVAIGRLLAQNAVTNRFLLLGNPTFDKTDGALREAYTGKKRVP